MPLSRLIILIIAVHHKPNILREGKSELVEQILERSFPRQKRTEFVLEKLIKFELVFKFIVLRFACTASSFRLGMPALRFENLSLFSLVHF